MRRTSMDVAYFDNLYAKSDGDPWQFATSDYEMLKYAATLAALPRPDYRAGLEIGCSIGVLTCQLATRCHALTATEPAYAALEQARSRCAVHTNVTFMSMQAPAEWPAGTFDLILLSEVVYYMTREQVGVLAQNVLASLAPDGHVELVHWIRETDYPLSGDDAVACFVEKCGGALRPIRQERTADYRLDLFARPDAPEDATGSK